MLHFIHRDDYVTGRQSIPQIFQWIGCMLHFICRYDLLEDGVSIASSSLSSESSIHDALTAKLVALAAANKYGLDRLRLMSEFHLCKGISVHCLATTSALADGCHAKVQGVESCSPEL